MEIAEIHIYQHDLPVKNGPYTMASSAVWELDTTLVKLFSDTGHVGCGETCPVGPTYAEAHAGGARAALKVLAEGLIGTEAVPGILHRQMDRLLNGHNYAKACASGALCSQLCRRRRGGLRRLEPKYIRRSGG